MEDYAIDLPAETVVGWIVQAVRQSGSGLLTNAWREYVLQESFAGKKSGYEETGVQEVTPVGSLEVVPEHQPESWILRVRVEDELGGRIPPDEDALKGPEEISLGQFWEEFISPLRGAASIWVSASGRAEKRAFDDILTELEREAKRASRG